MVTYDYASVSCDAKHSNVVSRQTLWCLSWAWIRDEPIALRRHHLSILGVSRHDRLRTHGCAGSTHILEQ